MKKRYPIIMFIPAIILFGVFFIIPTVQGLYYSFTHWNLFDVKYAGMTNYMNILTDTRLNGMVKNTFLFATITTIFKVGLGLMLALFVNRKLRTKNYLRTVFFIPAILSPVAVGIIFSGIMHPKYGFINVGLRWLKLDFLAMSWLTDTKLALYSVMGVEIWQWTGFTMLILLAGLQSIPKYYYEAASIDGATAFQKFRAITLPLIMPAFNNALILSIIGGLKVFGIIYATTGGGPGRATQVFGTFVFDSFSAGRYGEAAAANIIQSGIIAIVALSALSILRKKEVEF